MNNQLKRTTMFSKKQAFTLAETLTTLMVIGIVAALTLPAMMTSIKKNLINKQTNTFLAKFTEGLRQMRVDDKLNSTYTTEEFTNEMKKYFKIAQICPPNNLTNCFADFSAPDDESTKQIKMSEIQTQKALNTTYQDSEMFGIAFTDGTSMILSYIPECIGIEAGYKNPSTEFTDLTKCIHYLADINGKDKTNQYNTDIIGNIAFFDIGIDTIVPTQKYSKSDCEAAQASGAPILNCSAAMNMDYYAAAVDGCYKQGKRLPTIAEFQKIADELYTEDGEIKNQNLWLSIGGASIPTTGSWGNPASATFFSQSEESNGNITTVVFSHSKFSINTAAALTRAQTTNKALCID